MELYSSESSDSDEEGNIKTVDFSMKFLDTQTLFDNLEQLIITFGKEKTLHHISRLNIYQNILTEVPENIYKFYNLRKIDISNNRITSISEILTQLPLHTLILRNNYINDKSFPKSLENLEYNLEKLNLSGNNLTFFPEQIFCLRKLKYLYLGENFIGEIPLKIHTLNRLEIFSLGGNEIQTIPNSVCQLRELRALILSDNQLESLPACIANLTNLRILQVHRNKLSTLPNEIVTLKHLTELNLRENPLVDNFISGIVHDPPTLQELSARIIKLSNVPYSSKELPKKLYNYLESSQNCVNPKCKGVYFDNRVEHIKFVDFCGKYRVPLLQYLCSSKCIESSGDKESTNEAKNNSLLQKVLLG